LSGVRLLVDDQPVPIISQTAEQIRFHVPWELNGRVTASLSATESPFEQRTTRTLQIEIAAPEFLYSAEGLPLIAHQDFRGLVTRDDPARPGEIVHLYMTGLGPVTPASPLSHVSGQLVAFWQGGLPTNMPRPEVLFAGLAPGFLGVYQVDVRVPQISPTVLGISVQVGNSGTAAEFPVSQF
jgi:minor extracellular serine protease Vpr